MSTRSERRVAESWGRLPGRGSATEHWLSPGLGDEVTLPRVRPGQTLLAHGLGRSYGDVCLNDGQHLLRTERASRYLDFDPSTGLLTLESGVSLAQVFRDFLPRGWMLPTTPGTQFVTIGGAIANDVHGKNHHRAGTMGCHVREIELLRSNGERLRCSREIHSGLFGATIGGLGLTGLITRATVQLVRTPSSWMDQEIIPFGSVEEYFELVQESLAPFEYTVSWVDCLATGKELGRGLFLRGNLSTRSPVLGESSESHEAQRHALHPTRRASLPTPGQPRWSVPFEMPSQLLCATSVRLFNALYFARVRPPVQRRSVPLSSFFYPLDGIAHWNRLYGHAGLYQWQGVIPGERPVETLKTLLKTVSASGQASPLVVLKSFGGVPSPGLLSFPLEGVTLAVDFRNRGAGTVSLLHELEAIVRASGGRIYPAKDAVMKRETFLVGFPRFAEFVPFRDPAFSSAFARRLGLFEEKD